MSIVEGSARRAAARACLAALVALSALSAPAGCLLTTNLTDLTSGSDATAPELHSIGGSVTGLDDASITLSANGTDTVVVRADGAFVFPVRLPPDAVYIVTALPLADNRTCVVENGQGHVGATDVTNIAVTCPSSNANLASLVLSRGVLSPPFAPSTTSYTALVPLGLLGKPDGLSITTLTATTARPVASLAINGEVAVSGQPRAIAALRSGPSTVTVTTRATDQRTERTYTIAVTHAPAETYVKASNPREIARFGSQVALSSDGTTLAVGADSEENGAKGINGNPFGSTVKTAGAAYVFRRTGDTWAQEAYVKPSNTQEGAIFGRDVTLSADGNVLVVGAPGETSAAKGINGDQTSTGAPESGAAYVFRRSGSTWMQEAYLKASNARAKSDFGFNVTLSPDGNLLAVAAMREASAAIGVNGNQDDVSAPEAGAVYLFRRTGETWAQEAYLKPSHRVPLFGGSVAISSDGTLAIGTTGDASGAVGVNGDENDTSAPASGAVFLFRRLATTWTQEAYVKPSNTRPSLGFGQSVALSAQGTLAVGASGDASSATGINTVANDTIAPRSGAAYVFRRSGTTWVQEVYVKPSNTHEDFRFGTVALSGDGTRLAVGSPGEASAATGINGDQASKSAPTSGAVYLFFSTGTGWAQQAYVKANHTRNDLLFGGNLAMSADGSALAVCAPEDASSASGVNGDPFNELAFGSGAVHVFR